MRMRIARNQSLSSGLIRVVAVSVSFVALLVSCGTAVAQFGRTTPRDDRPRPIRVSQRFSFDVLSFKLLQPPTAATANEDSDRVDVYLAVPYRSLSFSYAIDKYVADYGAIVQITDQQSRTMVTDKYQTYNVLENVSAHEEREARSIERADAEQFSFHLAAGRDFEIRIDIQDLSTHHDFDTVFRYSTKSFQSHSATLSNLMVYRSHRGDRILPSIGPDVSAISIDEGGVFAELYNAPADSVLAIVSEISARDPALQPNENVLERTVTLLRTPAGSGSDASVERMPIFQDINFDDLWLGHYLLRTYILPKASDTSLVSPQDLERRAIAQGERAVDVHVQRGIPITATDLNEALDQLRLIATNSEWDSLDDAQTVKDKRTALIEFWRKRNPTPNYRINRPMQVFYSRVQYANDHFGGSFQQGWKTDRGRVYIALGPPEYIETHPYDAMQKPYEDWQYTSLGVDYTFVDPYMLGDFQLTGPPPAPGTFIWN